MKTNTNIKTCSNDIIMDSLKTVCFCFIISLKVATSAHSDSELRSLYLQSIEKRELEVFGLQERDFNYTVPRFCFEGGDCVDCFGAGFQLCPDSEDHCYKPGDSRSGFDTCPSSESGSDGSTSTTDSDTSTSPTVSATSTPSTDSDSSTLADTDSSTFSGSNITTSGFCDNGGFDCKRCFGSTFIPCPESGQYASDSYCYDPSNSTSICPDGTSPAEGSGSGDSDTATESESTSYTAATPSATAGSESSVQTSSATGTGTAGNDSIGTGGVASTPNPTTFTSSRPFSATASNQTSATSNDSNGDPISATRNGQSFMREGIIGYLAILALCFTASTNLVI
jgi:hypothetical protein